MPWRGGEKEVEIEREGEGGTRTIHIHIHIDMYIYTLNILIYINIYNVYNVYIYIYIFLFSRKRLRATRNTRMNPAKLSETLPHPTCSIGFSPTCTCLYCCGKPEADKPTAQGISVGTKIYCTIFFVPVRCRFTRR